MIYIVLYIQFSVPSKYQTCSACLLKKENNRLNFLFFSSGTCWWITSTTSIDTNHEAGKKVELWKHLYVLNHETQPNPFILHQHLCNSWKSLRYKLSSYAGSHFVLLDSFFFSQTLQIFEPMNINIFDS